MFCRGNTLSFYARGCDEWDSREVISHAHTHKTHKHTHTNTQELDELPPEEQPWLVVPEPPAPPKPTAAAVPVPTDFVLPLDMDFSVLAEKEGGAESQDAAAAGEEKVKEGGESKQKPKVPRQQGENEFSAARVWAASTGLTAADVGLGGSHGGAVDVDRTGEKELAEAGLRADGFESEEVVVQRKVLERKQGDENGEGVHREESVMRDRVREDQGEGSGVHQRVQQREAQGERHDRSEGHRTAESVAGSDSVRDGCELPKRVAEGVTDGERIDTDGSGQQMRKESAAGSGREGSSSMKSGEMPARADRGEGCDERERVHGSSDGRSGESDGSRTGNSENRIRPGSGERGTHTAQSGDLFFKGGMQVSTICFVYFLLHLHPCTF